MSENLNGEIKDCSASCDLKASIHDLNLGSFKNVNLVQNFRLKQVVQSPKNANSNMVS